MDLRLRDWEIGDWVTGDGDLGTLRWSDSLNKSVNSLNLIMVSMPLYYLGLHVRLLHGQQDNPSFIFG